MIQKVMRWDLHQMMNSTVYLSKSTIKGALVLIVLCVVGSKLRQFHQMPSKTPIHLYHLRLYLSKGRWSLSFRPLEQEKHIF